jgi:hypothetical protein
MPTPKAAILAIFALGVVLRLPTFTRPLLSDDEAIYATTADALTRGDKLYRDAVDHKPPLIYHVYQAGFVLFGPYDTHGAHALVVVAVLATAALLFAIGGQLAAAGLFLIFSTTWHDYDALAANCELFLLVPQAAAAWLLLRTGPGVVTHLGVGVLIGISALFKYQGLTFLGASIGFLLWRVKLGEVSRSWAASRAMCHVAGALLPAAVYCGWCAIGGNAAAARYWFEFNFSYVGAGLTGLAAIARGAKRTLLIGGVALVPYALGIAAAIATARQMRAPAGRRARGESSPDEQVPEPAMALGVLWLATSAIALGAGGRFFGHYFHLVLAPLCLLAAPSFSRLARGARPRRALLFALCALPALAFFALATFARPLAAKLDEGEPRYDEVAAGIAALAKPDERIFVWGNSPQLYVLARRPMGTRFSFCNYMTGESPGTPTETGQRNADANQLPAAWDMLFADLDRRRPALIVDAAAAGWDGYGKYPMSRYPRLRKYVDAHYWPAGVSAGVVLYRRLR